MKKSIFKVTFLIAMKKVWKYCVLIIIPLVYLAVFNVLLSFLVQEGIDEAVSNKFTSRLVIILMILLFACFLFCVFFWMYNILRSKIKNTISYKFREDFLYNYMIMAYEKDFFYSSGDISVRFMEDCEKCAELIPNILIPIIKLTINIIIGIVYVVVYSWQMAIMALLLMPLFFMINVRFLDKLGIANNKKKEIEGKQRTLFQEIFENLDVIKVFGMKNKLCSQNSEYYSQKKECIFEEAKSSVDMEIITQGGITVLEITSLFIGIMVAGMGLVSVGSVVGIWNAITGSLIYPISDIPFYMQEFKKIAVSWGRINSFINLSMQNQKREEKAKDNISEIIFENVSYGYGTEAQDVLQDISVTFYRKEIVILQGASGSGKTTLIKLLLGKLTPRLGKIVYKSDARIISNMIRDEIAYLPQSCSLFSISIYDNICLGLRIPKQNVIKITKELNLHEWIETLPKKYDTIIGIDQEVSGGEAQRICLARCLVRNPSFIVMDEPFSALDENNINLTCQKIEQLNNQGIGCIISTHIYPDSLKDKCKIIKVRGGRVQEMQEK